MTKRISRREAMKQLSLAGALVPAGVIRGQSTEIVIAGTPVEIAVSSLSPATVRIAILPVQGARPVTVPVDGAVADDDQLRDAVRKRDPGAFGSVRAGGFVVRFTPSPPTLHIDTRNGQAVQRLTFNDAAAGMTFLLPKGPVLGLGEGGPQFDRKGQTFANRSGQGGYQLATHGGRVPIQWVIGTRSASPTGRSLKEDGWAIFIHRPLGAFDLTGAEGKFLPAPEALPLDVFVVNAREPATTMKEYARITGHPEMTALWTLGYQQSHRTLSGFESVRSVAQTFREKKLPCDALIYLGTGFTPSGWNAQQSTTGFSSANREFTFHPENFPNSKSHIDELHMPGSAGGKGVGRAHQERSDFGGGGIPAGWGGPSRSTSGKPESHSIRC